jgi:hypothetical protein
MYGAELLSEFYNSNTGNLITLNTLCGARIGANVTTTHSTGSQRITFVRNISTGFSTSTQSGGTTAISSFTDLYLGGRDSIVGSGTVTIADNYGIYQADAAATNWFEGFCTLRLGASVSRTITNLAGSNTGLSAAVSANFSTVANGALSGLTATVSGTASSTYTYNTQFNALTATTEYLQSGASTSTVAYTLSAINATCGINSAATAAAAIVDLAYGVKINKLTCWAGTAGLTFNNYYGLYVDASVFNNTANPITVTSLYGIYQAGADAINYFQGKCGVNTTASSTTALNLPAGVTGVSSLRIAHGAAPSAPVDGDMWSTTAGLFIRINGVTKTVTLT